MELLVGEWDANESRFVSEGVRYFTVRLSSTSSSSSSLSTVGVVTLWSFEGDCSGVCGFVGEVVGVAGRPIIGVGVAGRTVDAGEEGVGDSGRRKGDVRGEPKDSGEGL